jgi:chaperonin GroES
VRGRLDANDAAQDGRSTAPLSAATRGEPVKGNLMAKQKFRPLHDRVVVKRIEAEEKTKGGIIIPDTAKEKPSQGEITAVGPGGRDETGKLIPIDIKVGDRVLFGKWSGTEVTIEGEEVLIMKESDIMGVLT